MEKFCRLLGFTPEQTAVLITDTPLEYSEKLRSQEHGRDLTANGVVAQIGRLEKDNFWYRYIYPKNLVLFDNEKLVAPEISKQGNFSYDIKGEFYSTTKIYGYIKKDNVAEDYKFWLGLLNSQLFWFFIQNTGYVLRGEYFTFKTDYVQPFPVPDSIPTNIYESISEAVGFILKMKAENIKNDTLESEKYIDKCVYSLYKLSKEDIAIIENDDIELLAQ